jgi:sugar lactone lactonase YvrE
VQSLLTNEVPTHVWAPELKVYHTPKPHERHHNCCPQAQRSAFSSVLTEIVLEIPQELESRFNDVIADPVGRVFCGTMSSDNSDGRLYRLDLDCTVTILLEGIGCSNGMAFTADRRHFYCTDFLADKIYLGDVDSFAGAFFRVKTNFRGVPEFFSQIAVASESD